MNEGVEIQEYLNRPAFRTPIPTSTSHPAASERRGNFYMEWIGCSHFEAAMIRGHKQEPFAASGILKVYVFRTIPDFIRVFAQIP